MSENSGFDSLDELFNHPYFTEETSLYKLILRKYNLNQTQAVGLQVYLIKDKVSRAKSLWSFVNNFREKERLQDMIQETLLLEDIIAVNMFSEANDRQYPWLIGNNLDSEILEDYRNLIDYLFNWINIIWHEFIEEIEEWDNEHFDSLLNWGNYDV